MTSAVLFHLAIPINDTVKAKAFYQEGLGCGIGRENANAIIFNFYGHQLVAHKTQQPLTPQKGIYPRHFGLIFTEEEDWSATLAVATAKSLVFYEQPKLRFPRELTEHNTFFLEDPFYNLLEFKYYHHQEAIFGGRDLAKIGDR
jgi:hypothetical protein